MALKKLMSRPLPISTWVQRVADVHDDMDLLFVLAPADEAIDGAIQGAWLDVQRIQDQTSAVQLFNEAIHIAVLGREDNDFLPNVGPLPDFAGDEKIDVCLLRIEREGLARFEVNDGCQFPRRHRGQAEVFDVDDMPRQRHDSRMSREVTPSQKLLNRLSGLGRDQLRGVGRRAVGTGRLQHSPRRGMHDQFLAAHLQLQHFHAVMADVHADGLHLRSIQSKHIQSLPAN